jgi:hypothetical protein
MSATRDRTQKIAFLYTNLYQVYKQQKEGLKDPELISGVILKAGSPQAAQVTAFPGLKIKAFEPAQVARAQSEKAVAVESLRENLKQLNTIHARLKHMLQELEELTKD